MRGACADRFWWQRLRNRTISILARVLHLHKRGGFWFQNLEGHLFLLLSQDLILNQMYSLQVHVCMTCKVTSLTHSLPHAVRTRKWTHSSLSFNDTLAYRAFLPDLLWWPLRGVWRHFCEKTAPWWQPLEVNYTELLLACLSELWQRRGCLDQPAQNDRE